MALLLQQRKLIKNIRDELWLQGIYWKEGKDSAFIRIIAPDAPYHKSFMERVIDTTEIDPYIDNREYIDKKFWDCVIRSFDLPNDLDMLPSGKYLEKLVKSYIEFYIQENPLEDTLLQINDLKMTDLLYNAIDIDLLYLRSIKRDKIYLPDKLQKQFEIEIQSPNLDNMSSQKETFPCKAEIDLLRGYIHNKKGDRKEDREKAITIFENIDWQGTQRRKKENRNKTIGVNSKLTNDTIMETKESADSGLLKIIKKTVEHHKVGNKSNWKNEDLFLLITTNLKYPRNYQQLMYDWLNKKNERDSEKDTLKINIANTLKFEFNLWENWEDDKSRTFEIITKCIVDLKKHYKPTKTVYKPSFSTTITEYAKISKEQKEILNVLSLASSPTEIKEIIANNTKFFTKNQKYQSFLRKAADILFHKGEYIILNGWVILNLFSDIKNTPEMTYLIAHMYGSGQLGKTEKEKKEYYELACSMLIQALNESKDTSKLYADLNTSAISNDLRRQLPNLENSELRQSVILDFTSHYLKTFEEDTDYYPGINLAYMLSLSKKLYPKVRRFNNQSIEKVYNISKISLEIDQNSHKPYNTRNNKRTYTIEKIAKKLNMPTENVKNYIQNAKLTFPNTHFRNILNDTLLTKPDYDQLLSAIKNRDKRYYSYITENEFLALNDSYSTTESRELLQILYDIQPTRDQLNRTLRQLYLYQYMLQKGNKEPSNSIFRLVEDLESLI